MDARKLRLSVCTKSWNASHYQAGIRIFFSFLLAGYKGVCWETLKAWGILCTIMNNSNSTSSPWIVDRLLFHETLLCQAWRVSWNKTLSTIQGLTCWITSWPKRLLPDAQFYRLFLFTSPYFALFVSIAFTVQLIKLTLKLERKFWIQRISYRFWHAHRRALIYIYRYIFVPWLGQIQII